MRVIITAVGPDNWGLADPIVHHVTSVGAHIAEIQMYDHDGGGLFAMLLRLKWPGTRNTLADLRAKMAEISRENGLSIRAWARDEHDRPPRLAICVTYRPEPPRAVLEAICDGRLRATPVVLIGNRPACRSLADQFGVDWHMIGDAQGNPDNERLGQLFDHYEVDYIVLARYMRLIPPSTCWKFAGGRVINLHHGLLPAFPGAEPYRDAHGQHMLTYGATVHFIVPELDAGGQIIHQETFTVAPGTPLEAVVRVGQRDHEPRCLVEGLRRVLYREVALHFDKVVPVARQPDGLFLRGPPGDRSDRILVPDYQTCVQTTPVRRRRTLGNTPRSTETLNQTPSPLPREKRKAKGPSRRAGGQAAVSPCRPRRFARVTSGFWLGGVTLGTLGAILGAAVPYQHPVAVAASALWWGIYFGCFGASVGALFGLFGDRGENRAGYAARHETTETDASAGGHRRRSQRGPHRVRQEAERPDHHAGEW
jgi:formyltetrahydrofolate deformylase